MYRHGTGKITCSFIRILLFSPQFLHAKNYSSSALRWAVGWGNLVQAPQALRHYSTTTRPGPCSESLPPLGREGALRRHRRYAVGETWDRWGSIPVVLFPWDGRSPVSHPTYAVPFPPRRIGEYRKGMISARPRRTKGSEDRLGIPKTSPKAEVRPTGRAVSRERLGDWDGPMAV